MLFPSLRQQLRRIFGTTQLSQPSAMKQRPVRRSFELRLELLEARMVPSTETTGTTFVVFRTADDTFPGSLRREILDANATSGPVTIDFDLGTSGAQVLQPTRALPAITNSSGVTVDGTSEPGFSPATNTPLVVLDGSKAGIVNGLVITGGNSTVKGLVIENFRPLAAGLVLNSNNNTVQDNFIGTDATGTVAQGNYYGIYLPAGASNNTIGGTTAAARNVISGNTLFGVLLESGGTSGNVVEGNFIGTTAAGSAPLANANAGVVLSAASGNTIGGTSAGAANVIAGNGVSGILLASTGSTGNVIQGNFIGTDSAGATGLGNTDFGILLNFILEPANAAGNTIGGTASGAGNVIGDNGQFGVVISGSNGNLLQGNFIGITAKAATSNSPEPALANGIDGVLIEGGAANNTLGGTAAGAGNVISGNARFGVQIDGVSGSTTTGNVLQGNLLGTDASGTMAVPNGDDGVAFFLGAAGNTVGGTATGAGNVLSGNGRFGVYLNGTGTSNNVIEGNLIGVDSSGAAALGNGDDGVALLSGASSNTIGGTASGAANTIAANKRYGVLLGVTGTNSNLVEGNFIGTNSGGATTLGNKNDGVEIVTGAAMNAIGGTATGAGNTIAGNVGNGVLLASSGTTGNMIQGNFIGTDIAGTLVLGNKAGVVDINSAANNLIGALGSATPTGAAVVGGNVIANNAGSGVIIGNSPTDTGAVGNAIVGNQIYANGGTGGIGIDLGNQGKPATQPAGPGPNNFQPAPMITSATVSTENVLTINFSLTAPAGTYRLEFFLNNSTDSAPQGRFFLGSENVTVTTTGTPVTGSFVFTPTAGTENLVPAHGQLVTATATRLTGTGNGTPSDTSEFSSGGSVM